MIGIPAYVSQDQIIHNLSVLKNQAKIDVLDFCKYSLPYAVAGTVFVALHDILEATPAPIVAKYAVNATYLGVALCVLKSAHVIINKFSSDLSKKEATHIVLSNEDFEALQKEIIQLRQDVIEQNRRLNLTQRSNGNKEFDNIRFH
jgi:hypothetical protein